MHLPFQLQFLKRGKALCSAAFPTLVESWNWMASALSNMKGDHDVNQDDGHISVDWTAPDHPVIRCVSCKAKSDGGSSAEVGPSAWQLTGFGTSSPMLENCFFMNAGQLMGGDDISLASVVSADSTGFICASFALGDAPTASAQLYATLDDVQTAQKDLDNYVVPLWYVRAEDDIVDLRTMAQLQVYDFATYQ